MTDKRLSVDDIVGPVRWTHLQYCTCSWRGGKIAYLSASCKARKTAAVERHQLRIERLAFLIEEVRRQERDRILELSTQIFTGDLWLDRTQFEMLVKVVDGDQ